MRRAIWIIPAIVLVVGCCVPPGANFVVDAFSVFDESAQVQAVLSATDSNDARDAYRKLFAFSTTRTLHRLQSHSSDTIAIQAAWEEVERTVPRNPNEVVRPDHKQLVKFIDALEKRGRLKIPPWWSEAILDARSNRRGNTYAGGFGTALHQIDREEQLKKWSRPPMPARFEEADGKLLIRTETDFAIVPNDLKSKLGERGKTVALIRPKHCVVAMHDDWGSPYRLAYVDRETQQIRWVSECWGSINPAGMGFSGCSLQWLEITEQDDRIIVFGDALGFHVEAFRVSDGQSLFRFSNYYSSSW
jgi:hypothetical protein